MIFKAPVAPDVKTTEYSSLLVLKNERISFLISLIRSSVAELLGFLEWGLLYSVLDRNSVYSVT